MKTSHMHKKCLKEDKEEATLHFIQEGIQKPLAKSSQLTDVFDLLNCCQKLSALFKAQSQTCHKHKMPSAH